MVSEIRQLVDVFTEIENRTMTNDTFWKVLKHVTSILEKETDDSSKPSNEEGRSQGEQALVDINREMLQNTPLEDETAEEVAEANEMDQMAWFQQLEMEDSTMLDSDDDDKEEPGVDMNRGRTASTNTPSAERARSTARSGVVTNTHIVTAEAETEVTIGTSKQKVKVRKAVLNTLGLQNVVELGRKKMITMKIPQIRFRKRCRLKREVACLQEELSRYLSNKDGVSKKNVLLTELNRNTVLPDLGNRVEFCMMKKRQWIMPSNY